MNTRLTSISGVNSPFLAFIIKLPSIHNDVAYDGTSQVLLYTEQRLLRDYEVETEMEITYE